MPNRVFIINSTPQYYDTAPALPQMNFGNLFSNSFMPQYQDYSPYSFQGQMSPTNNYGSFNGVNALLSVLSLINIVNMFKNDNNNAVFSQEKTTPVSENNLPQLRQRTRKTNSINKNIPPPPPMPAAEPLTSSLDPFSDKGTAEKSQKSKFKFPVAGGILSSKFGRRKDPITGKNGAFHSGVDIKAPVGSPIAAAKEGIVKEVVHDSGKEGYGNYVVIEHSDGTTSLYGHCNELNVKKGQSVQKGQSIATVGSTGRSTGPHVHFEVKDANGKPVDPEIA